MYVDKIESLQYMYISAIFIYLHYLFFSEKRPEQSIASARASVMIYDDQNKKWIPAGSSLGLSKVCVSISTYVYCLCLFLSTPTYILDHLFI